MRAGVSLLLAAAPLLADFDAALWRLYKPVEVGIANRVSGVRLDKDVLAHSRSDFADLRLVREGAEVPYVLECGPERETVAALTPKRSEEGGTSNLLADLGARLPFDRVRLVTPAANFYRSAAFDVSEDGKRWQTVVQCPVYRVGGGESLALSFRLQHSRYLRLRIFNRDDSPVPVTQLIVEGPRAWLKFLPKAAGAYRLYYGNPDAKAPGYDLGVILAGHEGGPMVLAAGPEQPNPDRRPPPAPWTERQSEVLFIALAAAALGLGWVVIRFWMRVSDRST